MSWASGVRRGLHAHLHEDRARVRRRLGATTAVMAALAATWAMAAGASAAAPTSTHYTNTLPDGATWIADVPSNWNGALLLYSHGYGPLIAADAPDPRTKAALLSDGYALAGSSYDPNGPWWALNSAVTDQFQTLAAVERLLPSAPQKVYAVGTSMGGLISALEDQNADGRLNGALTTCGIVAGANNLNQYQLDGEYAMSQLLAPGQNIQLTNFNGTPSPAGPDSLATAAALMNAGNAAQGTPQGRARLALAMAFLNVSPWGGSTIPNIYDYAAQEQGQYDDYFVPPSGGGLTGMQFIVLGRNQIERSAGGESSGTVGVNFASVLHRSSYYPEVRALYTEAGLSLRDDLVTLQRNANLRPDPWAYHRLSETSVPTGRLQVPELDLHTISDQLVPVQQEAYYHALVVRAGDSALLRQAFVLAQGHCNFTTADLVAGLQALESRVNTGSWGTAATATSLNTIANGLDPSYGGGDFVPFWPNRLTGAIPLFGSPFGRWEPFAGAHRAAAHRR